jgi:hypothetical protein
MSSALTFITAPDVSELRAVAVDAVGAIRSRGAFEPTGWSRTHLAHARRFNLGRLNLDSCTEPVRKRHRGAVINVARMALAPVPERGRRCETEGVGGAQSQCRFV